MKFGCCTSLFGEDILSLAQAGADYGEIGLSELAGHTREEVAHRAGQLQERGVACLAANLLFPGVFRLTGEQADHSVIGPYLEDVLDKAALLGVETVVFGSGGARSIPQGFPREKAWEQLRQLCTEQIVPAFASRSMVCCVEPLNRKECNVLNTCAEAARLVREVQSPCLRLLVDLYHLDLEQEPRESLKEHKGLLAHAHIASAKNSRALPSPNDGEDYGGFFRGLQAAGYTGRLSLEGTITGSFTECVSNAVATLRQVWEQTASRESCMG